MSVKIILLVPLVVNLCVGQLVNQSTYIDQRNRIHQIPYDAIINYFPLTQIYDFTEDYDYYYAATNAGIWRYHKFAKEWDFPITTGQGLPSNSVTEVYYDSEENVLIARAGGKYCVYQNTWDYWEVSGDNRNSFLTVRDFPALLQRKNQLKSQKLFSQNREMLGNTGLTSDRRFTLQNDGKLASPFGEEFDITLYFASSIAEELYAIQNFGIGMSTEHDVIMELYRLSVPRNTSSMLIDNDDFWFGGFSSSGYNNNGFAVRWPNTRDSWDFYYPDNNDSYVYSFSIHDIIKYGDDLYAATDNGLLTYASNSWFTIPGSQNKAYSDIKRIVAYKEDIYAGTDHGLAIFDLSNNRYIDLHHSLRLSKIYDLEKSGNTLFIAAREGIYRHDINDSLFVSEDFSATLVGGVATSLSVYGEELWIGTADGFIRKNLYTGEQWGQNLSVMRVQGPVTEIAADNHHVFIAVPDGIVHLNRKKEYYRMIRQKDGIAGGPILRLIIDGDAVWAVSATGVTQWFYEEVKF
jgi:hypothetical protein